MTTGCPSEFRNLLVAFNGSSASIAALRIALDMAQGSNGHVTGLLAHGSSLVSSSIPDWFSDKLRNSIIDTVSKRAIEIQKSFVDEAESRINPANLHWLEIGGDPDGTVSDYSRMYDLTLVGRSDGPNQADELALHPGMICESSGRPVMVVPGGRAAVAPPSDVLIAWDGMRPATGAVAAAMPILRVARKITAVTVESGRTGRPLKGIDLREMLRRHDLDCDWVHLPPGKAGVSQTILDLGKTRNCDLIVLGVPSHGQVGRLITGSIAQHILHEAESALFVAV